MLITWSRLVELPHPITMDWRIKRNATLLLFDTGDAWTGSCIFIRVASFRLSMRITSYCLTFWPLTAVLLFAFVQQHCALVACYSKWVIVAFYSAFLFSFFFWCVCVYISPPKSAVYIQCCLVVTWLVPRETRQITLPTTHHFMSLPAKPHT